MKIGVPCYPLALVNKIPTNRKYQCSILETVIHPSLLWSIFNCRTQQVMFMVWQGQGTRTKKIPLVEKEVLSCLSERYKYEIWKTCRETSKMIIKDVFGVGIVCLA